MNCHHRTVRFGYEKQAIQNSNHVTYLVVPDHARVHLRQILTLFVMVHSFSALTLDELLTNDSGFHSLDP
jgi:hypothetical protein